MKNPEIQICPRCDQEMTETVYYIPEINQCVCEECLETSFANSIQTGYEDIQDYIEKSNIEIMSLETYIRNYSPGNEDEIFEARREDF